MSLGSPLANWVGARVFWRGGRKPYRRFAAWIGALAILLNAVVVQSHFDARSAPLAAALSASASASNALAENQDKPPLSACALCETAAFAGGMVLDAPPALPVSAQFELETSHAPRAAPVAARASHAWRSRAPPSFLI